MMINAKMKNEWADNELSKICEMSEGPEDPELEPFRRAVAAYKKCNEIFGDNNAIMETHVLKMLLNEDALSPIEDNIDEWILTDARDGYEKHCHERRPSLRKVVDMNTGLGIFTDIERVRCIDINKPYPYFYAEMATKIVDAMCPIQFPYHPISKYKMYTERFSMGQFDGTYDTLGFLKLRIPGGKIVYVNQFYKIGQEGWIEIDQKEYLERRSKWEPEE